MSPPLCKTPDTLLCPRASQPLSHPDLKVAVWLDVDFQAKPAVDPMTLLASQLVEGFGCTLARSPDPYAGLLNAPILGVLSKGAGSLADGAGSPTLPPIEMRRPSAEGFLRFFGFLGFVTVSRRSLHKVESKGNTNGAGRTRRKER